MAASSAVPSGVFDSSSAPVSNRLYGSWRTAIRPPDASTIRLTLVASGSSGGETQLLEETPYQPIRPSATAPSR